MEPTKEESEKIFDEIFAKLDKMMEERMKKEKDGA